jgi:hypothetical protein
MDEPTRRRAGLRPPSASLTRDRVLVALLVGAMRLLAGACAPPVGAARVNPQVGSFW